MLYLIRILSGQWSRRNGKLNCSPRNASIMLPTSLCKRKSIFNNSKWREISKRWKLSDKRWRPELEWSKGHTVETWNSSRRCTCEWNWKSRHKNTGVKSLNNSNGLWCPPDQRINCSWKSLVQSKNRVPRESTLRLQVTPRSHSRRRNSTRRSPKFQMSPNNDPKRKVLPYQTITGIESTSCRGCMSSQMRMTRTSNQSLNRSVLIASQWSRVSRKILTRIRRSKRPLSQRLRTLKSNWEVKKSRQNHWKRHLRISRSRLTQKAGWSPGVRDGKSGVSD